MAARFLVAADDRTGALEVAGMCAEVCGRPVLVRPARGSRDDPADAADAADAADTGGAADVAVDVAVVDLGTRHLDAAGAAGAATSHEHAAQGAELRAHKIDSTLRGNWAVEVVARRRVGGSRVLVAPSFPALGRTCVGGVVRVHGVPVRDAATGADLRNRAASSRPADLLRAAGAAAVAELASPCALRRWLDDPGATRVAVCDAADDDELRAVAVAWAAASRSGVLLAGTAATIAAGVRAALRTCSPAGAGAAVPRARPLGRPALVVSGSLHPVARAQVDELLAAGAVPWDGQGRVPHASVVVLRPPLPAGPVSDAAAHRVATSLAMSAGRALDERTWGTVLLVGGDTAAAVLGSADVHVGGTVDDGMPWCRSPRTGDALLVTKAGGFGVRDTLVRLVHPLEPS